MSLFCRCAIIFAMNIDYAMLTNSFDENTKNKFDVFYGLLTETNKKFNLTAITEKNDVYLKHFADSLAGLKYFESGKSVLEIGSGGGFPSVPLKIADESLDFTLVESNAKKCGYLEQVKTALDFNNFLTVNARAEEFALKNREKFDYVTARAVAPSAVLCELTLPCLKIGGKGVFYKNYSEEEINNAGRAAEKLGCRLLSVNKYALNGVAGERCVILIEKIKQTSDVYPRAYNKILKKTL